VETGQDVEAGVDRLEDRAPPGIRKLAAGRGDADEQCRRWRLERQRLSQAFDGRDVVAGQPLVDVPAGDRRIQDRRDGIRAVADDAHRRLGMVIGELTLGQDDEPTLAGWRGELHEARVYGMSGPRTSRRRVVGEGL
jgi:hypothetical protein